VSTPKDFVLLCDKPPGVTSHDVVASVRRTLARGTKVGHAGTLDPFATGLLLVLVGRATRIQRFLMALAKTYVVTARFGAVSSTGDPEGEIVATGNIPEGRLELPTGRVRQTPPAYSAIKVGGRRAYTLARAGISVALPEREIEVYRFEEQWRAADRRGFVIECSSGTYVRSLIADLGDAYCEALRRTRIGAFDVADADPERPVGLPAALAFLPELRLDPEQARRAGHGVAMQRSLAASPLGESGDSPGDAASVGKSLAAFPPSPEANAARLFPGVVRLTDAEGLIALAQASESDGSLKPIVGFR
jgi:tRNA pseudouridine55 synthase